jgi:N-acetyl-gamma-glutamyl-phosphate reductase
VAIREDGAVVRRRFSFCIRFPRGEVTLQLTQEGKMEKLQVGVVGAAGYTGAELARILVSHPKLNLAWLSGHSTAGQRLVDVLPSLIGVPGLRDTQLEAFEDDRVPALAERLDVVFTALPHATSARVGAAFLRAGVQVVDLSADYRLSDPAVYEEWYGAHPEKDLLREARYGLVEWHREELFGARLIAAPGCYPTSAILALGPLLRAGLIEPDGIIIDSKSGVSGAGRKPLPSTHLPECSEGMRPYKVAGTHRHTPEIEQELSRIAGLPLRVLFTPQLAPMTRGILTCAYGRAKGATAEGCREAAREVYKSGLVSVLPDKMLPDTLWVRGSARGLVAYEVDERTNTVLAFCAIDNLAKGASAQAVQALNVSRGWPEELGLPLAAQFP